MLFCSETGEVDLVNFGPGAGCPVLTTTTATTIIQPGDAAQRDM